MEKRYSSTEINNDFYDELGKDWFHRQDHPIALLRAENKLRIPWISEVIFSQLGSNQKVLDIGCGAGLLTQALASSHQVWGLDMSLQSLNAAKQRDVSQQISYIQGSADKLPFASESFDVACALDLLEHVKEPQQIIKEAARVLKRGGLFFFHTFNRNLLSYFLIIKAVDWFIPNTPKRMHILSLFLKPKELISFFQQEGLLLKELKGVKPELKFREIKDLFLNKRVPESFSFTFTSSLKTGYCGFCLKL